MAKKKAVMAGDLIVEPPKETRPWAQSAGMYIAGRAYVDEADQTAVEMEKKWGVDRLRLLVDPELREKFDRQRFLFNRALWAGELEDVKREAQRMVKAWLALDRAAEAAGAQNVSPLVWEVPVETKRIGDDPSPIASHVVALVRDNDDAHAVIASGRQVTVYTLAEVGRLLAAMPDLMAVKQHYPGATVVAGRGPVTDPLDSLHDFNDSLDGI